MLLIIEVLSMTCNRQFIPSVACLKTQSGLRVKLVVLQTYDHFYQRKRRVTTAGVEP